MVLGMLLDLVRRISLGSQDMSLSRFWHSHEALCMVPFRVIALCSCIFALGKEAVDFLRATCFSLTKCWA